MRSVARCLVGFNGFFDVPCARVVIELPWAFTVANSELEDAGRGGHSSCWPERSFNKQFIRCAWKPDLPRKKRYVGREERIKESVLSDFSRIVTRKHAPEERKHRLAQYAMSCIRHLPPSAVSNIFVCCKRGSYINKKLFALLGDRTVYAPGFLSQFGGLEMSSLIQALGMLWRLDNYSRGFFPGFDRLVKVLIEESIKQEEDPSHVFFNERSIANLIHGLGCLFKLKMGYDIGPDIRRFVDILLEKVTSSNRIGKCKPQEVSSIFFGCGSMGHKNEAAFGAFAEYIVADASLFGVQSLSNLIYAFAHLGYTHEGALDALCMELENEYKLVELNEKELANVIHGLGILGYHSSVILTVLSEEIKKQSKLVRFTEQDLASIINGFGQLGFKDIDVLDALGQEVINSSRLPRFKNHELYNIISGLTRLEFPNEGVLACLSKEINSSTRQAQRTQSQRRLLMY